MEFGTAQQLTWPSTQSPCNSASSSVATEACAYTQKAEAEQQQILADARNAAASSVAPPHHSGHNKHGAQFGGFSSIVQSH